MAERFSEGILKEILGCIDRLERELNNGTAFWEACDNCRDELINYKDGKRIR